MVLQVQDFSFLPPHRNIRINYHPRQQLPQLFNLQLSLRPAQLFEFHLYPRPAQLFNQLYFNLPTKHVTLKWTQFVAIRQTNYQFYLWASQNLKEAQITNYQPKSPKITP